MNHHEQPGQRRPANGKTKHPDDVPSQIEKEADRERQAHPARTDEGGDRERSATRTDVESTHDAAAPGDIEREHEFNPAHSRESDPRGSGVDRELPRRD